MGSPPNDQSLLETLRGSLVGFRTALEGEDGRKVAALGDATGFLPELIRDVLGAVNVALVALREGFVTAEQYVRTIDAAMATIEVGVQGLEGFAAGFSFGRPPDDLKILAAPLERLGDAINRGSGALRKAEGVVTAVVLRPEEMWGIVAELDRLVGGDDIVDGQLNQLLSVIGAEGAGSDPQSSSRVSGVRR